MSEQLLQRIAITCSLLSLCLLYFISTSIQPPLVETFNDLELGQQLSFRGRVSQVSSSNKTIFLTIHREMIEEQTVLLFNSMNLSIQEGDFLEFEGSLDEYNGKKELIASKVTLLE